MHWGGTLYHVDDLPFGLGAPKDGGSGAAGGSGVGGMPGSYAAFREGMRGVAVRAALPAPETLRGLPIVGHRCAEGSVEAWGGV